MQNEDKNNKTQLGSIESSLDRILYGPETLEEARFERIIDRRKSKGKNHAK
jgi:hypothetical protein